jgi:hypothetical protein
LRWYAVYAGPCITQLRQTIDLLAGETGFFEHVASGALSGK